MASETYCAVGWPSFAMASYYPCDRLDGRLTLITVRSITLFIVFVMLFTAQAADACPPSAVPCRVKLDCGLLPWSPNCWTVGSVGTGAPGWANVCRYDPDEIECAYAFGWVLGKCVLPVGPCGGVVCYPDY